MAALLVQKTKKKVPVLYNNLSDVYVLKFDTHQSMWGTDEVWQCVLEALEVGP